MIRRLLFALAALALLAALLLSLTGGVTATLFGSRVSARSSLPSLVVFAIAGSGWLTLAWRARRIGADLAGWSRRLVEATPWLVATAAGVTAGASVRFATFSAAGSDASGYLSEAALLLSGRLSRPEPLVSVATWDNGALSLVPYGWRLAADAAAQVPTYAPGWPLLLTLPMGMAGPLGAFWLTPLAAAVAVAAVAALASTIGSPWAATMAAAWLATSPTFLTHAVQPMTDVPVTAAWLVCWVLIARGSGRGCWREVGAGAAAALAVLIRPNLAPLAAIPLIFLVRTSRDADRRRLAGRATAFSLPVAAAGLIVAALQQHWYGSPLASGYGRAGDLYAFAFVLPNASRYVQWASSLESPFLWLAPAALLVARSALVRWLLLFATAAMVAYLLYLVVEEWTYLRFLLPALTIAICAASVVLDAAIARLPLAARGLAACLVVAAIAVPGLARSRSVGAFDLAEVQGRSRLAGSYLAAALPASAVLVAGEQSGAVRYYTGHSVVRWDQLPERSIDAVVQRLQETGWEVWVVLDTWEEDGFRQRFTGTVSGALDWPPAFDAGRRSRTRAWRIADRPAFARGATIVTDHLR